MFLAAMFLATIATIFLATMFLSLFGSPLKLQGKRQSPATMSGYRTGSPEITEEKWQSPATMSGFPDESHEKPALGVPVCFPSYQPDCPNTAHNMMEKMQSQGKHCQNDSGAANSSKNQQSGGTYSQIGGGTNNPQMQGIGTISNVRSFNHFGHQGNKDSGQNQGDEK